MNKVVSPQSGPQTLALTSKAEILIYGGAAGSGKSFTLLLEALKHRNTPGFNAVIFRRTYPEITAPGGIWQESLELFTAFGAKPNHSELEWKFDSGARIKFSHLQHEADMYSWQGAQVALIEFDEATSFTEDQFWYLFSRNRSMCGVKPYMRLTTNPDPDSFIAKLIGWYLDADGNPRPEATGVIRWFVRDDAGELQWSDTRPPLKNKYPHLTPKSFTFIPGKVHDNRILLQKNPGYLANLQALDLVQRSRLLDGNWKTRYSSGLVFNAKAFKRTTELPGAMRMVRYWDRAATADGGDYTVGLLMGATADRYYVLDVIRGQWGPGDRDALISRTAFADGYHCSIYFEQEPGSSGKDSADALVKLLAGFNVRADKVTGSKLDRALPFAAQVANGNAYYVAGSWNDQFLRELNDFPSAKHDDQVDAASGAFNALATASRITTGSYSMRGPRPPERLFRSLAR